MSAAYPKSGAIKRSWGEIQGGDGHKNVPSETEVSDTSSESIKRKKDDTEVDKIVGKPTDETAHVDTDFAIGEFPLGDPHDESSLGKQPDVNTNFINGHSAYSVSAGDAPETTVPETTNTKENDTENKAEDEDNVSVISDLSDISSEGWTAIAGPMSWVQRQMMAGADPREILKHMIPSSTEIPEDYDDLMLWKIIVNILSEPPPRKKLNDINTLDDVLNLLKTKSKILVLTGAGVSVSCGIPDFRSRDGIYARLHVEYPDLPDPQAMFSIDYFCKNPNPFFKFAKEIYPGQFTPSPAHRFISLLDKQGKLLRNYTQNIDTLEQVAGITNVIQCHGSFATARCMTCKKKVDADYVKEDIMNQIIPRCPDCPPEEQLNILKPDIVFFGESLPGEFHQRMEEDKEIADLLIVIGSSLKVRPVALIPSSLPGSVPQILINRESLRHLKFDVELLGDCDTIVNELCHRLGDAWKELCHTSTPASQITKDEIPTPPLSPSIEENSETVESSTTDKDNASISAANNSTQEEAVTEVSVGTNMMEGSQTCQQNKGSVDTDKRSSTQQSVQDDQKYVISSSTDTPSVNLDDESASKSQVTAESCEGVQSTTKDLSEMSEVDKQSQLKDEEKAQLLKLVHQEDERHGVHREAVQQASSSSKKTGAADPAVDGEDTVTTTVFDAGEGTSRQMEDMDQSTSESDLERLRKAWAPKRASLSTKLPGNTFLFLPPCRYIFKGAEVYEDIAYESDSGSSSSDSDSEDEGSEKQGDTKEEGKLCEIDSESEEDHICTDAHPDQLLMEDKSQCDSVDDTSVQGVQDK